MFVTVFTPFSSFSTFLPNLIKLVQHIILFKLLPCFCVDYARQIGGRLTRPITFSKTIKIKANTIDDAAGEILGILKGMSKHKQNIYFHGWHGLGASTTLRVVAQLLKSSAGQEMMFDKVVHVDCSLWQSMRALQKAIAEDLELPQSVMAIFDQHDDEDDFNGIDRGSRGVILDIREEIFRKLVNSTFVVIFHNGSGHYINLYECGVPLTEFFGNKVLWTWGRRFRLYGVLEDDNFENIKADVLMGVCEWRAHVLHDEATEVAKYMGILETDTILECFKYVWERRRFGHIDWGRHASNYWVCDGIIQGKDNASASASAWEVGDALQRNINLDWIFEKHIPNANEGMIDRWVSATHKALVHGDIGVLPPPATSFFLLADKSEGMRVILPVGMFPDNNSLRVLHLSWCTFSFTYPPFLCCNHLRFLLLEHCADDVREEDHESNNHNGLCLQNLWVLDLRYTYWYSKNIMCLMDELRELNVEGVKDWMSIVDIFGGRTSLVKLRVTTDKDSATEIAMQRPVLNMSRAIHLKTIILENCVGLEQVIPSVLPLFLESFSFIIGDAHVIAKICSISFRGLAKLKSVLLRGLMGCLEELDLSGTAVKTLDLNEVVALNLKRLILLGCEKLQAIKWPPIGKRIMLLEALHIDTVRSASSVQANLEEKGRETTGSSCIIGVDVIKPTTTSFAGYISLRDARLLRSLVPVDEYFKYKGGHMEIGCSSPAASSDAVGGSKCAQGIRKPVHCLYARDVIFQDYLRAVATTNEGGVIRWMWPALPVDESKGWYVHLQDEEGMESGLPLQQQGSSTQGTSTGADLIPQFICNNAKKLHVHGSFSITSIPFPLVVSRGRYFFFSSPDYKWLSWYRLERCQVERCPKLSSVFATPTPIDDESHEDGRFQCFSQLTTFWASELPMARYIWKWSTIWLPSEMSFGRLNFVHLDYCPRLIHVLPLTEHMTTLPQLETIEIVCCVDLMEIFPLDPQHQEKQTKFPKLRHIHLHDLPKLQRICGSKMLAPELETVKIRGCWSLRRLPAVAKQCPKVDCEKDWWDSLEWDEGDANHHPSLYKPTHSRYYKKAQLPRGTVLR